MPILLQMGCRTSRLLPVFLKLQFLLNQNKTISRSFPPLQGLAPLILDIYLQNQNIHECRDIWPQASLWVEGFLYAKLEEP
jgi:hypothetical protein